MRHRGRDVGDEVSKAGEGRSGGAQAAFAGADVCIDFSRPGPGVILPNWVRTMARDAIVFACANPMPEISRKEPDADHARAEPDRRSAVRGRREPRGTSRETQKRHTGTSKLFS